MTIGIFQDIHANLPAFKKAVTTFQQHQCSRIYHVGDLVGIGPQPKEVFELAISIKELELIMGNHDYWFAYELPDPQPKWMSDEEVEHQTWTHQQIGTKYRSIAQTWKFVEELNLSHHRKISFLHYGYDDKTNWFKKFVKVPDPNSLDQLFEEIESDMVFYGHNHQPSDMTGNSRYVNLGSAGCHTKAEVRLGILDIKDDNLQLTKYSVPYDDEGLMEAFEIRKVPARDFITKTFITRP